MDENAAECHKDSSDTLNVIKTIYRMVVEQSKHIS